MLVLFIFCERICILERSYFVLAVGSMNYGNGKLETTCIRFKPFIIHYAISFSDHWRMCASAVVDYPTPLRLFEKFHNQLNRMIIFTKVLRTLLKSCLPMINRSTTYCHIIPCVTLEYTLHCDNLLLKNNVVSMDLIWIIIC